MKSGFGTPEGTARFADRFGRFQDFFRTAQGLSMSSLGLGTYLGGPDEATDRGYIDAARVAFASGINFFDTAINYRHQRSERALGVALRDAAREEFIIATKAGFLTPGAVPDALEKADVVAGMHSMAPGFLADQIDRSRTNLDLDTIDIFYLHNPETQLNYVGRRQFDQRLLASPLPRLEQARLTRYDSLLRNRYLGTDIASRVS